MGTDVALAATLQPSTSQPPLGSLLRRGAMPRMRLVAAPSPFAGLKTLVLQACSHRVAFLSLKHQGIQSPENTVLQPVLVSPPSLGSPPRCPPDGKEGPEEFLRFNWRLFQFSRRLQ